MSLFVLYFRIVLDFLIKKNGNVMTFSGSKYVVKSIDYRLTCRYNDKCSIDV